MKKMLFFMVFLTVLTVGCYAAKGDINKVLKQIHWLHHASFIIETAGKTIYIDPYEIKGNQPADYIFITHNHPDHLSITDIKKIAKKDTLIICTQESAVKLKNYSVKTIKPGDSFNMGTMKCEVVPAYNNTKMFHQKKDGKAGYIIEIEGIRVYHGGDTDFIPEMMEMKNIGIAILPIGGFYTANAGEAAKAVKAMKPRIAIPMHFGYRIGGKKDGEQFKEMADKYETVKILKEEEPK